MFRRRRYVERGEKIVVRVPAGESVTLRIETPSITVEGDAEAIAKSFGIDCGRGDGYLESRRDEALGGTSTFLGGVAAAEAVDDEG